MTSIGSTCIFLVAFTQLVSCINTPLGGENIKRRQADISTNPVYQRPTQFTVSSQNSPPIHSRGGLIMPANNQIQTNNFHPPSFPSLNSRYQQSSSLMAAETSLPAANNGSQSLKKSSFDVEHVNHQLSFVNLRNPVRGHIELALQQTSGDENVFQPSPTLNADWYTQSSNSVYGQHQNGGPSNVASNNNNQPDQQPSVTEHSNNIAQQEIISSSSSSSSNYQQDFEHRHTIEHPTIGAVSTTTTPHSILNQSSNVEMNNHVLYEGPGSAPPSNDYYFSSSEKLPDIEKSSNAWWALGFGIEFEAANNLTGNNYLEYCSKSEFLVNNKQRSLCKSHPKIMPIVARGLKMAIDECQLRFSNNRWNCSLALQDSFLPSTIDQQNHQLAFTPKSQIFGNVMKYPNRERSFLNAIVAAGIAHAMTKACSQGEMPEECSCDKRIRSKNNKGKIEWVACSDDIDFGARFSRDFTDNTDFVSDTTSMINAHNYEVGRRVFKSATDITCTCQNGENGLCQTKKCWKHLGPFGDIGDELLKRYESATHVQLSSKDPHKLRPVKRGVRKPKRKDLVYIDESPDYCSPDSRLGILGTQNRHCNSTSPGPDSCSLLCCGRGHQVVVEEVEEDCNCKFVWCCQVKCDRCKKHITNDVCN